MLKNIFSFPENKRIRVIISTDAKNEADDQYAIVYALLSPKIEVVGIAAAHFSTINVPDSMEQSYREIELILEKMGLLGQIPVLKGAPRGLTGEDQPIDSEAAQFIISQAHERGKPLYVINIGAITDLASAYLLDPSIARGIEAAIWLGGSAFPEGGSEFNLANDIAAGNVVMDSSINLWLIPTSASRIPIGYAELLNRVQPCGAIGKYLVSQLMELSMKRESPVENWIVWDIAGISVALDPEMHRYHHHNAPRFDEDMRYVTVERDHIIRVYDQIDARYTIEDMFNKLAIKYGINSE